MGPFCVPFFVLSADGRSRGEKDDLMRKRLALVLVALLVTPLLLTACSTASRNTAEDYMNALLKGDDAKALDLACDSFKAGTQTLLAWYKQQQVDEKSVDLQFDIGKGGNTSEIIVTGSYNYGDPKFLQEYVLEEQFNTRIVLWMEKTGGKWCVSNKSKFGTEIDAALASAAVEQPTAQPTEQPTAEPTGTPAATPSS
jgi:hypothetical protein